MKVCDFRGFFCEFRKIGYNGGIFINIKGFYLEGKLIVRFLYSSFLRI